MNTSFFCAYIASDFLEFSGYNRNIYMNLAVTIEKFISLLKNKGI